MKLFLIAAPFLGALAALAVMTGFGANSESTTLAQDFNAYRESQGGSPLAISSKLDNLAQDNAQSGIDSCTFPLPKGFSGTAWDVYGYNTADQILNAEVNDTTTKGPLVDTGFKSIGVGF